MADWLCARPSTGLRMTAARTRVWLVLRHGVEHGGDWPLRTSFDGAQDDSRTWVRVGVEVWWRLVLSMAGIGGFGLRARPSTALRMTAARGLGLVLRHGGVGVEVSC